MCLDCSPWHLVNIFPCTCLDTVHKNTRPVYCCIINCICLVKVSPWPLSLLLWKNTNPFYPWHKQYCTVCPPAALVHSFMYTDVNPVYSVSVNTDLWMDPRILIVTKNIRSDPVVFVLKWIVISGLIVYHLWPQIQPKSRSSTVNFQRVDETYTPSPPHTTGSCISLCSLQHGLQVDTI